MPVVLDPDAAAVYKAAQEAGRPAYETLTAPEARAYYAQARFATNPEAPELARVAPLSIPAPHGAIQARTVFDQKIYQDKRIDIQLPHQFAERLDLAIGCEAPSRKRCFLEILCELRSRLLLGIVVSHVARSTIDRIGAIHGAGAIGRVSWHSIGNGNLGIGICTRRQH